MVLLDLVEEEAEMVQEVVNTQASGFPSQLEPTEGRHTNVRLVPKDRGCEYVSRNG